MKCKRIGVIDSGKGGEYLEKRLLEIFNVKIYRWIPKYFISYSDLPLSSLKKQVNIHLDYLQKFDLDILIIGCMSLSTTLSSYIRSKVKIKVFDLYEVLPIFNSNTLIIGTNNTIKSNKFQNYLVMGCPNLSKYIEGGTIDIIPRLLESYQVSLNINKDFDTVILGCSHYPIAIKEFSDYYKNKTIINPINYLLNELKYVL